jgi:hypothetical protein
MVFKQCVSNIMSNIAEKLNNAKPVTMAKLQTKNILFKDKIKQGTILLAPTRTAMGLSIFPPCIWRMIDKGLLCRSELVRCFYG